MVGIDDGKIIFDKGEIVCNGSALHIDQGVGVTSHASQAKTVDQVIVSAPFRVFSQANEAQFYVAMSRARSTMPVFTDSKELCGTLSPGKATGFSLGSSSRRHVLKRARLHEYPGQLGPLV